MIVSWYFQAKMHDTLDIFTIFLYFQNTNLYYYYLTQTPQVPKLLDGAKILPKILTLWEGRNSVTDDRRRRTAHAIRRT